MVFSGKNLASLTVPLNAAIHVVSRQTSLGASAAAHFPHLLRMFFLHHWLFIPSSCCPGYSWAWESHVARKSVSATEVQGRGRELGQGKSGGPSDQGTLSREYNKVHSKSNILMESSHRAGVGGGYFDAQEVGSAYKW